MDTGKVTSKTSSLRALLLKAWSERWSDLQWGIHIKAILPRGVSGDVYNLADIIFQQALVGPGPNQLILSYLKHSLSSQLVSYSAVVLRISKFNEFHKPYCVISLLKFLENIQDGITCRTKQEEGVLASSILSLVNWLLHCYHYYLTNPTQFPELTEKPFIILNKIMQNPFTLALLYLSKYENKSMYEITVKKCREIESVLEMKPIQNGFGVDVPLLLMNVSKLDLSVLKSNPKKKELVDFSIQALLKVTALLNPTIDSQSVVNDLLIIQQLKGYKNSRFYTEIVRASFINLYDDLLENCAAYWGAFTFMKLPQIIQLLTNHYKTNNNLSAEQASKEVVQGFILLIEFCPLLNNIDTHTQNNNVETLLNEMVPLQIITEADKNKILEYRRDNSINTAKIAMLVPQGVSSSFLSIISKTTPALNKIMKSLDSDRLQEHFISMLSQLLSGKSYELILTFASVKGELRTFVHKLIKYNELSRQVNQNDGISPYVKALLFDLTFVILCSIVQKYGSDKVLPNKDGNSFFETWVRDCMKEHDCNKAMTALTKAYDTGKVETLIEFFKKGEFDIRNINMPWDEICFAMPAVMKEIHDGWRNTGNTEIHDGWRNSGGAVYANNDVKRMLETISSQMCCLSICSVSWLCSYMQILQQTELLKPRNMVQQFMTSMMVNEDGQQDYRTAPLAKQQQQDYYKDRCKISFHIMRQMQYEVSPPMTFIEVAPLSRSIISKDAVYKQLVPTWESVLKKGCLTTEAVQLFKSVISVSDPRLFMKFMLHEIIKLRFEDELNKAVDLLFALFYFNIHDCTVALLNYLPHLLFRNEKVELVEPQSTAIAKLTAYAVCAAVQSMLSQKRIEPAKSMDVEQELEGSKIMRMGEPGNQRLLYICVGYGSSSQQQAIADGPLLKALTTLFRAFDNVADQTGVVNSDTYFVFNVIQQIVDCGKETAKSILAALSNTLIPNLMRSVPDLFTMELILQLYSLNTAAGRKTAVRDLCLLRNLTMKQSC